MAKTKTKNLEIKISWLKNGDFFEIVGLEHLYKNLKLSNLTESGAYIHGMILDEYEKTFKNIGANYVISASTLIRRKTS